MSENVPEPPPELPPGVAETLRECPTEYLRGAADYAEELAEYYERQARLDAAADDAGEDRPEGVPSKATTTVKEINDNRYYYWQWREGDQIKSEYKGPVDPDE